VQSLAVQSLAVAVPSAGGSRRGAKRGWGARRPCHQRGLLPRWTGAVFGGAGPTPESVRAPSARGLEAWSTSKTLPRGRPRAQRCCILLVPHTAHDDEAVQRRTGWGPRRCRSSGGRAPAGSVSRESRAASVRPRPFHVKHSVASPPAFTDRAPGRRLEQRNRRRFPGATTSGGPPYVPSRARAGVRCLPHGAARSVGASACRHRAAERSCSTHRPKPPRR